MMYSPQNGGFVVGETMESHRVAGKEKNLFGGKVLGVDLILMDGDVHFGQKKHPCSSAVPMLKTVVPEEVAERLFFDGIQPESGGRSIAEAEEFARPG